MKQDLSCPIELQGCTLSYREGAALASVCLYNLTPRRVASFEAVVKWRSSASGRSVAAPFCAESLRAGGNSRFTVALSTQRVPDADHLDVLFTAVQFEDGGDSWRAGSGPVVEIAPMEPALGENQVMLQAVAGPDAVCYPRQDSQAWRCVCGRVNLNSADACDRCHRGHFAAIGFTPENVRFHYETRRERTPEGGDEEIRQLQTNFLRQHTKRLRRAVAMAVAALALAALLVLAYPGSTTPNTSAQAVIQGP